MTLCFAPHMASAAIPETPAALSGIVKNAGRCFLRPRRGSFQPVFAFLCFLSAILSTLPDAAFAAPAGLQRFANSRAGPALPLANRLGLRLGLSLPARPRLRPPAALSRRPSHDPQQLRFREHLPRRFATSRDARAGRARVLPRGPVPVWVWGLSVHRKMRGTLLDEALQPGLLRPWLLGLPRAVALGGRGEGSLAGGRGTAPRTGLEARKQSRVRAAKLPAGLRSRASPSAAALLLPAAGTGIRAPAPGARAARSDAPRALRRP